MGLTSFLFGLARTSADARAMSKGPDAVGKRVIRKAAGRAFGRAMRRLIK